MFPLLLTFSHLVYNENVILSLYYISEHYHFATETVAVYFNCTYSLHIISICPIPPVYVWSATTCFLVSSLKISSKIIPTYV